MSAVLIVDEIKSDREELARSLDAEGFQVVQSESPAAAVRDIWEGTYIVVFIAAILSGTAPDGVLIGLDRDPAAIAAASVKLAPESARIHLVRALGATQGPPPQE